ncbi:YL1 nuclear family protein [Candida albicans]|uniref:YL1 nuclear family protein n=1 Tax=Candida albicans TaxID=5476 RepID=A0A8H6BZY3_CANAX|nr:YL1 nuclear family protein [Candida albicans]
MSDSEEEEVFESLIATRSRRSNAGLRLKQLIALEEQSNELAATTQFLTEDDENVNLLFQEDGEDEEFIDEEVDNANLEGIDEESGTENENENTTRKRKHTSSDGEEEEEEENDTSNINADEILSDSELSATDSDESEGEKELLKQEKLKKKRLKKQSLIPTIKQPSVKSATLKKKQKRTPLVTADSLLLANRRSSSRAAAVESKQALVDKLKESEARRAKYVHVERKQQVELTQEERLAEAVETEKANVESLHRFREQEIVKKERQRQLLLSKRIKLHNVIRLVSSETFVKPIEEVNDARRQYEQKLLAEKKAQEQQNEIKKLESMNEKLHELIESGDSKKNDNDEENIQLVPSTNINADNHNNIECEPIKVEDSTQEIKADETDNKDESSDKTNTSISEVAPSDETESTKQEKISDTEFNEESENTSQTEENGLTNDNPSEVKKEENEQTNKIEETPVDNNKPDVQNLTTDTPLDETKRESSKEPTPTVETSHQQEEEIFEGPVQRVSRNLIYMIEFDEDKKELRLDPSNIKRILFGKQSLLPASRRFKDVKTILKIGKPENPYAVVKDQKQSLFDPASNITEDDPMFDELKKLPKLGVKQDLVEIVEDKEETESANIVLKTEAPTGLYLPNGNKKICMISGTEVKYFDPSTGIPYSSVEAYKILKSIEQGQIPWLSLTNESNDTGNVELYLGCRDGTARHAQGVPEGFDG